MNRSRSISTLACLSLLFLCGCTMLLGTPDCSAGAGTGNPKVDASSSGVITAGISIGDARQLASRYRLTGSKPLPPGIRKNLARGKPMPPGIAKTRLPEAFIGELPRHAGYEWHQAGADLVLVVSGSLVISDILEGVFD